MVLEMVMVMMEGREIAELDGVGDGDGDGGKGDSRVGWCWRW